MRREELEKRCGQEGMNVSTFYVYLGYSSIISRYAAGVYGLRGADISPSDVEALKWARQSTKVLKDYGWTADGQIWILYRLSEGQIKSGVISVPGSLKRFVKGRFELKAADGATIGTLVCKDNSAWGLGPFFRRRGGEPGDYMLLTVNLSQRAATIEIGDESLADDKQENR
jgi:hypothetical protein